MLAELLLCGIASMDVGLKTAANSNQFYTSDSSSIHEAMIDGIKNEALISVTSLLSNDWYLSNKTWIKNHGFSENNNEENNSAYGAQTISPDYDIQKDFENCDGYKTNLDGSLIGNDIDFYHFELFGNANVKINYSGPTGSNIRLYRFNTVDGNYTENACSDGESSSELNIEGYLNAGSYCFSVSGDRYYNNGEYDIDLDVKYDLISDVSIGEMRYSYGLEGINWVSDFDPLGVEAFATKDKAVTVSDDRYNKSMEKNLTNQGKVLQSSLYLWGDNGINYARDFLSQLIEQAKEHITDAENEKICYETQQAEIERNGNIFKLVISGLFLIAGAAVTIATAGAGSIAVAGLGAVVAADAGTLASCTLFTAEVSLYIGDCVEVANADKESAKKMAQSLVYENKIMNAREMLDYLEDTRDGLTEVYEANQDLAQIEGLEGVKHVANIKSYYDLDYDTSSKKLDVKRVKEFNAEEVVYKPNMIPAYPDDAYMRGSFYGIKKQQDIQDAQKHIRHEYPIREIEESEIEELECPGSLPEVALEGQAKWLYFDAPTKGTYLIGSGGGNDDKPSETQTLVCELFGKPVNGRSEDGVILSDYSTGNKGNFRLHYYMEAGERVYLRIRGKSWDDVSRLFSIHVFPVTIPTEEEWRGVETFVEDDISFHFGANSWKTMTFEEGGYKTFQCYSNDNEGTMKLCNYRGQTVAESNNISSGYAGNGFLTAEVNPFELYFLQVVSPAKAAADDRHVKLTAISVDNNYPKISDLDRLYLNNSYNFNLEYGIAKICIFVPSKKATYQFFGDDATNINVYDTFTGEKLNIDSVKDLDKTDGNYKDMAVKQGRAVATLNKNHEYLVMNYLANSECSSGNFELNVDIFSNGYYVVADNINPITVSVSQGYFEMQNTLYASPGEATTRDNWFKFDSSGYRIFTIFGNCANLRLELFDAENKLLAEDKNSNGTSSSSLICYYIEANKNYRVRIVDTRFLSSNVVAKLTITLVPEQINSFESMNQLYSGNALDGGACNWGDNRYGGCNAVGCFVPDKSGYYSFCMTDPYPKALKVTVVDTTSSNYVVKDVDYSGGVAYEPHGSVLKYLTKGRYYYVVYAQEDKSEGSNAEYQLRISYYGDGGGSGTKTPQYSAGLDREDLYVVYTAAQTGYICVDTTIYCSNGSVSDTLSIYDMTGDGWNNYLNYVSPSKTITKSNRQAVIVYLTKGTKYMIQISKSGYTATSGYIYVYFKDTTSYSETENFYVNTGDDDERYAERTCYLYGIQTMTYNLRFQVGGQKIIQTFGYLDTVLFLTTNSGDFVAWDDNNGYKNNALIKCNLASNKTYKLIVGLKSVEDGGRIKTAITPVSSSNYYSSYTSFRQATMTSSSGSRTVSFYVYPNTSDVVRFIPLYSGYYTFTLRSDDIDCYLHVIDPLSATPKGSKDYNDDGNGTDSVISKKYLYANREYFVVASSYSFSCEEGNATLTITK